jgi:transcriptional regulator with XRE-family HTH domain
LRYARVVTSTTAAFGSLLRDWRQRRRLSQLELAGDAEISTRHLSFLETGRSQASRDMVLRLAERLDVPLREQNELLMSAGYAPVFPERPLADAALDLARKAIDIVLTGHEPYPAVAIDRHWTLVASNRVVGPLLAEAAPELLQPPVNVLRVTLHPGGLAPRLANYAEWRLHVLDKLRRQIDVSGDRTLSALLTELRGYPAPDGVDARPPSANHPRAGFVVPFQLVTDGGTLSFFSTTTVFGTPIEVTLSELSIESFYPADRFTMDTLLKAEIPILHP